jgi:hypothetical protein
VYVLARRDLGTLRAVLAAVATFFALGPIFASLETM